MSRTDRGPAALRSASSSWNGSSSAGPSSGSGTGRRGLIGGTAGKAERSPSTVRRIFSVALCSWARPTAMRCRRSAFSPDASTKQKVSDSPVK
ncbi:MULTISPECIES: hypothetical protein [unclassified Streptomyces]|uniref:hypothetical protein n=1 Tax=unclassified Streptomyces TaxID=2593676 RepID=UPI002E2CB735|nr:hypothetical protein [Streptomyces sp. NBC_00342]